MHKHFTSEIQASISVVVACPKLTFQQFCTHMNLKYLECRSVVMCSAERQRFTWIQAFCTSATWWLNWGKEVLVAALHAWQMWEIVRGCKLRAAFLDCGSQIHHKSGKSVIFYWTNALCTGMERSRLTLHCTVAWNSKHHVHITCGLDLLTILCMSV